MWNDPVRLMEQAVPSPVFKYTENGWADVTGRVPKHDEAAHYTLFSYNVWFHGYNKTLDPTYHRESWLPRMRALLKEARSANADFLCFNEVRAASCTACCCVQKLV